MIDLLREDAGAWPGDRLQHAHPGGAPPSGRGGAGGGVRPPGRLGQLPRDPAPHDGSAPHLHGVRRRTTAGWPPRSWPRRRSRACSSRTAGWSSGRPIAAASPTALPRVAKEQGVSLREVIPADESLESVFNYLVEAVSLRVELSLAALTWRLLLGRRQLAGAVRLQRLSAAVWAGSSCGSRRSSARPSSSGVHPGPLRHGRPERAASPGEPHLRRHGHGPGDRGRHARLHARQAHGALADRGDQGTGRLARHARCHPARGSGWPDGSSSGRRCTPSSAGSRWGWPWPRCSTVSVSWP